MLSILPDLLFFIVAFSGFALLIWPQLDQPDELERFALALAGGLLIAYLSLFILYWAAFSLRWFLVFPAAGWILALGRPGKFRPLWNSQALRRSFGYWLLLSWWCLGWHALISSYSGGGWSGDWWEHYDRAEFFLRQAPKDYLFLGFYPLVARPPLMNLLTAGFMSGIGDEFFHYQIFTTLFSCLVWFPAVVLLRQQNKSRVAEISLLLLLMCSPFFLQNATFPWTKLGCAFFVLMAISQLSPGAGEITRTRLVTGAVLLAGGLLVHYSAGPWICSLFVAGAWTYRRRLVEKAFLKATATGFLAAAALCSTWFGWAILQFGVKTTFTANTAVGLAPAGTLLDRTVRAVSNLWYTLWPVVTAADIPPQVSPLGQWRDYWFMLYQLKLPSAFGLMGAAILVWKAFQLTPSRETQFWRIVVVTVVILGTASHSQPDLHGLAHISLQPLVVLGLLYLAAIAAALPNWLLSLLKISLIFDLIAGIGFHFAVQSFRLESYLNSNQPIPQIIKNYPVATRNNWSVKSALNLEYLSDVAPPSLTILFLGLIGLLAVILYGRAAREAPF